MTGRLFFGKDQQTGDKGRARYPFHQLPFHSENDVRGNAALCGAILICSGTLLKGDFLALIHKIAGTGLFPAKWIGCDATFGSDSNFLKSLPQEKYYFAGIRSNTKIFLEKPEVGLLPYKGRGPKQKK